MERLSEKMNEEIAKDIAMYFGTPPYDIEHIRQHRSSGLFEQQALAKYGMTPVELIQGLQNIDMSDRVKEEAVRDLTMYFGEPPAPKDIIEKRLSSGLLELQVLAKYSMTIVDLMEKVGFKVSD
jgi:hypothetical protein